MCTRQLRPNSSSYVNVNWWYFVCMMDGINFLNMVVAGRIAQLRLTAFRHQKNTELLFSLNPLLSYDLVSASHLRMPSVIENAGLKSVSAWSRQMSNGARVCDGCIAMSGWSTSSTHSASRPTSA